jgi:hypothetical protein
VRREKQRLEEAHEAMQALSARLEDLAARVGAGS